jgi:hypothetical protein
MFDALLVRGPFSRASQFATAALVAVVVLAPATGTWVLLRSVAGFLDAVAAAAPLRPHAQPVCLNTERPASD